MMINRSFVRSLSGGLLAVAGLVLATWPVTGQVTSPAPARTRTVAPRAAGVPTIDGPTKVPPYTLGRFEVTGDDVGGVSWVVSGPYAVQTEPPDGKGVKLSVVAPPGRYQLFAAVKSETLPAPLILGPVTVEFVGVGGPHDKPDDDPTDPKDPPPPPPVDTPLANAARSYARGNAQVFIDASAWLRRPESDGIGFASLDAFMRPRRKAVAEQFETSLRAAIGPLLTSDRKFKPGAAIQAAELFDEAAAGGLDP